MIRFNPPERDIELVMFNLRRKSIDELRLQGRSPFQIARWLASDETIMCWAAYTPEGNPAALIGAIPAHKGNYSLFGFGTDEWTRVWRLVTLVGKRDMMQAVRDTGAHRASCLSPAHHTDTHKWLRFLGASHEAEMPGYGINGEDFIMFSWLKDGDKCVSAAAQT